MGSSRSKSCSGMAESLPRKQQKVPRGQTSICLVPTPIGVTNLRFEGWITHRQEEQLDLKRDEKVSTPLTDHDFHIKDKKYTWRPGASEDINISKPFSTSQLEASFPPTVVLFPCWEDVWENVATRTDEDGSLAGNGLSSSKWLNTLHKIKWFQEVNTRQERANRKCYYDTANSKGGGGGGTPLSLLAS